MFTGIIQAVGTVKDVRPATGRVTLTIHAPEISALLGVGDSVATQGVCLTCVTRNEESFSVDVSAETIRRSTLGSVACGDRLNLEPAMRLSDRLGGHLVSGHVDATGSLEATRAEGDGWLYTFRAPAALLRFAIEKGSIAVDGVSLTLFDLTAETFNVALIPHTLEATTLGTLAVGAPVNLEADLIGKYVERLLSTDSPGTDSPGEGEA